MYKCAACLRYVHAEGKKRAIPAACFLDGRLPQPDPCELSATFAGMKAASVNEIKQQLKEAEKKQLIELCLRLARHKKENKELLTYLLFEADDEQNYLQNIKAAIDEGFAQVNTTNIHFAKKTIRKVLRQANKFIRFSGSKTAEAEILLHYCTNFRGLKIPWQKSMALKNIYATQLKKIAAAIDTMHEDLQYDYKKDLQRLEI
ncbi:MAG: hypothetical protein ABR502_08680 [Chitinophagaceae bacterium]